MGKSMYTCGECGYASRVKLGKCPSCSNFATMILDSSMEKSSGKNAKQGTRHIVSDGLHLEKFSSQEHIITTWPIHHKEIERVLQGGIRKGGIYLLGGAPGIGKSTFVLQLIEQLCIYTSLRIGYFSGEEHASEVDARFSRLSQNPEHQQKDTKGGLDIYHAPCFEDIMSTSIEQGYDMVLIDSIQTVYAKNIESAPGSIQQVKRCAEKLSEFGKKHMTTVLIIGHITKGGEIAGPKYLEHIVDVVLYLEGDAHGDTRFLRAQKNRFGHTDEIGVFEMTLFGLQAIYNLTERILQEATTETAGSVFTLGLDNGRPVLARVEVLLHKAYGKFPQRTCVGVDSKRVDMICAILAKYCRCKLEMFDIYVHIPGEFRFFDSGLDLAIAAALYGQYHGVVFPLTHIFVGEVLLSGTVQKTKLHHKREKEVPNGMTLIDYTSCPSIHQLAQL